jgi:two-component system CheB/CheR fusion protein
MARKKRSSMVDATPVSALPGVNPPPGESDAAMGQPLPFVVVGIGASAGGIEATSQLLRELAPDTGMAFVVVQHLDPTHPSMLAEIFARTTSLAVAEASDHVPLAPNRIYIIPHGKNMVIGDGRLQLSPRTELRGQHRPIDLFLRSLAEHQGHLAIGVILSGSLNDGTLGLEEVKAAGGMTFAQDDTAAHTAMPRSAIAAGCVDFVLAPEDIAREIARISRHPYVAPSSDAASGAVRNEAAMGRVLDLLRHETGVDFTNYKRNTLHRRITRRMLLHKFESLQDYVRYLQGTPAEVDALYQDILINVTSFFRDPDAYEALKSRVFPQLIEHKSRHEHVRVWALGCSTGEEAYSIAMAYAEWAETSAQRVPMQIFATDLNAAGIDKARSGVYPKGVVQDLSPERLRRFFVEIDGSYRISKPIRDMCIFARQNVLADPPFSRMDLIACRNMLIYFEPVLQHKLLPMLHYSLQARGFLWLGTSETIGTFRDLFEIVDAKSKIYSRKSGASAPAARPPRASSRAAPVRERAPEFSVAPAGDPQREADRILLQRFAPAGVLVDPELEIRHFRGDVGPYLAPISGRATLALLRMLREGLNVAVRGAIRRAQREKKTVRVDGLRVRTETGQREVDVTVIPLAGGIHEGYLLITFEPGGTAAGAGTAERQPPAEPHGPADESEIDRLRQELDSTREYLQTLLEQQEAANEELQSANEEVQSANEELQSINEELETSKEEIQSSNEELATVNDELQNRNHELSQTNDDLVNLLTSVQMPILMLGRDLRIRRFTPLAEKLLNLIPSDIGRPIGDIHLGLSIPDFEALLIDTIDKIVVRVRLVQDRNGRWFALRVHPYKTLDNRIDGAVLVLVDIDEGKRTEAALRESEHRFSQLADSAPVLIWLSGADERRFVNKAYLDFVGASEAELQGTNWMRFIHPDDLAAAEAHYGLQHERREPIDHQFRFRRRDGQYRWMKTVALPRSADGEFLGYIGFKADITDLKEAEASLRDADRSKNNFLATLAHELRTPLAALRNAVQIIGHPAANPDLTARAKSVMDRQTSQMMRMVDDLLDLSRLTRGTFRLRLRRVDLVEPLRQAIAATAHEREAHGQQLSLDAPDAPIMLEADAARLEQVFTNLLGNAARYSPPQAQVWITVERSRMSADATAEGPHTLACAIVRLRDDGIGIAADMLPHIFDLFAQADQAPTKGAGLGIGLNLARRLIELHDGRIEARSDGKDRGTEFTIHLPVEEALDAARGSSGGAAAQSRPRPGDPVRVLVVDDNADAADMLVHLLTIAEQDVRSANAGTTALQVADEFQPELILLDISMPDIDGIEVSRRLRANARTRGATIVAVTGYAPSDTAIDLSRGGFDQRVTKPLEYEALLTLVAGVQQKRRR